MKIFLSHSFDKKDKKIVNWFLKFIPSIINGAEIITAQRAELKEPWAKIKPKIDKSRAVVGIFTKDEKLSGKNRYKTRDWILSETSYAVGRGIPTFVFIEDGVVVEGVIKNKEYINFNKKKIKKLEEKTGEYLTSELSPIVDQTHTFNCWKKKTVICKSYYGITEHIIDLTVTSKKFSGIKHSFAIFNLPGKIKLPPWSDLNKKPNFAQFTKPIFFVDILEDCRKKRALKVVKLPESDEYKKVFMLTFSPNLKPAERLKYVWGWGCPKVFLPNKKGVPSESGITVTHSLKKLILELEFEKGFPLEGSPWIDTVDQSGNVLNRKINFSETKNEPRHINFEEEFAHVRQNIIYKGRWKIKKKK